MSIDAPKRRTSAHPRASHGGTLPPSNDVRAVEEIQDVVGEAPIDEGTYLTEVVETSYGEGIAPLFFNKGDLSLFFLFVLVSNYMCTYYTTLVIMIMWTSFIIR